MLVDTEFADNNFEVPREDTISFFFLKRQGGCVNITG